MTDPVQRQRQKIADVMKGIIDRYGPGPTSLPKPPPDAKPPPKPHHDAGPDIFGDDSEPGSDG